MITIFRRMIPFQRSRADDTDPLNRVALCFVVDTTGSMAGFIRAAQRTLLDTIDRLSTHRGVNLRIGLVAYRDHPPQDKSYVTRVHSLTDDRERMQKVIGKLRARGGGDGPEAVYRGLYDAVTQMPWRDHSSRYVMLVGDAPPHGFEAWYGLTHKTERTLRTAGDAWPHGCPSGLDVLSVTAAAEEHGVTVFALCMGNWSATKLAFTALATATGGPRTASTNADDIIGEIEALLQHEYEHLDFDRQTLDAVQHLGHLDTHQLAADLACSEGRVAASPRRWAVSDAEDCSILFECPGVWVL